MVSYVSILTYDARHIMKARVNSHEEFADALQAAQRAVKKQAEARNDLDSDVKVA